VAQGVGSEFKPQYHKNKQINKANKLNIINQNTFKRKRINIKTALLTNIGWWRAQR
jgi:hypothetical protein